MARTTSNLITYYSTLPVSAKVISTELSKTPFSNQIFRNKTILSQSGVYILFEIDAWKYNPQLFCEHYYKTQYYYPIILIANDLGSVFDFIPEKLPYGILAPDKSIIGQVLNLTPIPTQG